MKLRAITSASLLGALLTTLAACGGASAEGGADTTAPDGTAHYPVIIHRPLVAGRRFHVAVEARQIVQAVESIENPEEVIVEDFTEDTHVMFVAAIQIVEVDGAGRAARAEVTIETFEAPNAGGEILPAGTEMVVGWEGDELNVQIDGAPADERVRGHLALAFPLERPGSTLGDDLFGTDTPRAVGESWDLNDDSVIEDLGDDGYTVTETNLHGQTTFTGLSACGDTECMVLEAAIAAEQVTLAEEWQMADFEAGELEGLVRLQLPTDASRSVYSEEAVFRGVFVAELREGDETTETLVTVSRARNAVYSDVTAE